MPDLSKKGVDTYWKNYNDPIIYRVVTFMEGVEKWTSDRDPDLEAAMEALGKTLDTLKKEDYGKQDDAVSLCCHLRTGRALRFLQSLDVANPGAASKLLVHAEDSTKSDNDQYGLFLRRNIVFERLRLLSRVFSPSRLDMVKKALEDEDDK